MPLITLVETTIPAADFYRDSAKMMEDFGGRLLDLLGAGTLPIIEVEAVPAGHRLRVLVAERSRP